MNNDSSQPSAAAPDEQFRLLQFIDDHVGHAFARVSERDGKYFLQTGHLGRISRLIDSGVTENTRISGHAANAWYVTGLDFPGGELVAAWALDYAGLAAPIPF